MSQSKHKTSSGPDWGPLVSKLKSKASIIDVVDALDLSKKYGLQKNGYSLQGDCPTGHQSTNHQCFSIDTKDQFFNCFSCGEHGDIISLVSLVRHLSFVESLEWIADACAPDMSGEIAAAIAKLTPEDQTFFNKAKLFGAIYEYGKKLLTDPQAQQVMNYLTNDRKYDAALLDNTEFIYWDTDKNIRAHLDKKFPGMMEEIKGLRLIGNGGDIFRLAIPYKDRNGVITGYLKRAHTPMGFPIGGKDVRWDSTPGTTKSDLFGLHRIRNKKKVLIVEGYPDATYLPALGLDNIVALGQGAFSDKYLDGLNAKGISEIILALDNDETGHKNTESIILDLNETAFQIFVVDPQKLTPHKDPDEFVKANGIDAFRKLVEEAVSGGAWYSNHILKTTNLNTDQGKTDAINAILEFAAGLRNPIEVRSVIDTLTAGLKLTPELLNERFEQFRSTAADRSLLDGAKGLSHTIAKMVSDGKGKEASQLLASESQKIAVSYGKSKVGLPLPLKDLLAHKKEQDAQRKQGELLGLQLGAFPILQKKLNGVQTGLYIIAADPNVGKTMFQVNLAVDVLNSNPGSTVLFYSMDDSRERIIDRFLAKLTGLSINTIQFRLEDQGEQKLLDDAYEQLNRWCDDGRLEIHELTEYLTMTAIQHEIRENKNRNNTVVFIDGLYNVPVENEKEGIREQNIERANEVKNLVKIFKIPVIVSAELRKRDQNQKKDKKRSLHDIMESGKYGYNADIVWLIHDGGIANGGAVVNMGGVQNIQLEFAKNKLSGFKGVVTMDFSKEIATFKETGEAEDIGEVE